MQNIADRVVTLRRARNLTQELFAKECGVSRGYLSQIEAKMVRPGARFLRNLEQLEKLHSAEKLAANRQGRSVTERSQAYSEVEPVADTGSRRIPIFTLVPGGPPVDYQVMPEDWQDTTPYEGNDPQAFALRLTGDSMMPKFEPGMILTVSPSSKPSNGDHVIATIKNEGSLFKRFYVSGDHKTVTLTSYNAAQYPPIVRPREDFHEIFKVVAATQKL